MEMLKSQSQAKNRGKRRDQRGREGVMERERGRDTEIVDDDCQCGTPRLSILPYPKPHGPPPPPQPSLLTDPSCAVLVKLANPCRVLCMHRELDDTCQLDMIDRPHFAILWYNLFRCSHRCTGVIVDDHTHVPPRHQSPFPATIPSPHSLDHCSRSNALVGYHGWLASACGL